MALAPVAVTPSMSAGGPLLPAGVSAQPVAWGDLAGWSKDDHAQAWRVWLASCARMAEAQPALRAGAAEPAALQAACRAALALGPLDGDAARAAFEARFSPWRILPSGGAGFFTGYFEPEIEGDLAPGGAFPTPLYGRPADLVTLDGIAAEGPLAGLAAARREPDGSLAPYADRAAIEAGALAGLGLERAFVADPVERFFLQVQGSGRLRLAGGRVVRLVYDGRNGHPYTAIGRIVADREGIPRPQMTMSVLRAWLAADAGRAREVLQENRSFVFFRLDETLDAALGPIGGEGLPLTPGRSLAIDRAFWPYGLPVHVSTEIPEGRGPARVPFARLMVAQDTGTAIVGAARGDIFFGSGAAAGDAAGEMRAEGTFTVLWPRGAGDAP